MDNARIAKELLKMAKELESGSDLTVKDIEWIVKPYQNNLDDMAKTVMKIYEIPGLDSKMKDKLVTLFGNLKGCKGELKRILDYANRM